MSVRTIRSVFYLKRGEGTTHRGAYHVVDGRRRGRAITDCGLTEKKVGDIFEVVSMPGRANLVGCSECRNDGV